MTLEELLDSVKDIEFERIYEPVEHNPIRPVICTDNTHNFVSGYSGVNSNTLNTDNDEILGYLCYDACDEKPQEYQHRKK